MSATIQHAAPIATAAKLFCGFSDPTRLAIITTLADGEQRVSDIVTALNGSQGNSLSLCRPAAAPVATPRSRMALSTAASKRCSIAPRMP